MAEILLFHHAQGQTPGIVAFADNLRTAKHTVHAPDLYDGKTFATLDQGGNPRPSLLIEARSAGFAVSNEAIFEQTTSATITAGWRTGQRREASSRSGGRP